MAEADADVGILLSACRHPGKHKGDKRQHDFVHHSPQWQRSQLAAGFRCGRLFL